MNQNADMKREEREQIVKKNSSAIIKKAVSKGRLSCRLKGRRFWKRNFSKK